MPIMLGGVRYRRTRCPVPPDAVRIACATRCPVLTERVWWAGKGICDLQSFLRVVEWVRDSSAAFSGEEGAQTLEEKQLRALAEF
eukprot:3377053-Rhodomonas_salina.2